MAGASTYFRCGRSRRGIFVKEGVKYEGTIPHSVKIPGIVFQGEENLVTVVNLHITIEKRSGSSVIYYAALSNSVIIGGDVLFHKYYQVVAFSVQPGKCGQHV